MESCGVFVDKDFVYVVGTAKTVPGFTVESGSMTKLPRSGEAGKVGRTVLAALWAYKEGVAAPPSRKVLDKRFLEFTGHRSRRRFEDACRYLLVQHDGRQVKVTPTAHGRAGGFTFKPGEAMPCNAEPEAITKALWKALERCD